jgi:hypothetical protein
MDLIKGLTKEQLLAIAYNSRCAFCQCDLREYYRSESGNYWDCADCNKRTCDDCKTLKGLTEEEEEDMDMNGYICVCCRKEAKEEDKSK